MRGKAEVESEEELNGGRPHSVARRRRSGKTKRVVREKVDIESEDESSGATKRRQRPAKKMKSAKYVEDSDTYWQAEYKPAKSISPVSPNRSLSPKPQRKAAKMALAVITATQEKSRSEVIVNSKSYQYH